LKKFDVLIKAEKTAEKNAGVSHKKKMQNEKIFILFMHKKHEIYMKK
jgi:hypothetical protein